MEGLEEISFRIIAAVGTARSYYIEAIQKAKENDFAGARQCIKEGETQFLEGHRAHASIIASEASQNGLGLSLLLVHAEDQLMSAETFKIFAEEFIELYERMKGAE